MKNSVKKCKLLAAALAAGIVCQGMALFSIEEFFAVPKNGTLENE